MYTLFLHIFLGTNIFEAEANEKILIPSFILKTSMKLSGFSNMPKRINTLKNQ